MKKVIILFTLLILGSCVFAEDFNVYKLDNGQTVIIDQIKTNPIVTIDTWIKTGSIDEDDNNNGVAHFLEHLFFKGTKDHPNGEFDKIIESKGGITNAATSKDFTHYYLTIPSEHFDLALKLHADMLLNPQIPRKELEKERKVVLEEIAKDKNVPSKIAYDNLNSLMYNTHPYKRPVIGRADVIENIRREEILDFFNKHYAPSNMVTIIVGDVEPQAALDKVKESFIQDCKKVQKTKYKQEQPIYGPLKKIERMDTQSGYLLMGFRSVNGHNPDTYALDVLATILGEGRSSRLYKSVKERQQLAFSIGAGNATHKDDGMFFVSANFVPQNVDKVENAIFEEINQIKSQGVTQSDLQLAKNIIQRDTYYARESISNISSEIGYTMVLTDSIKFYEDYLKNINKVTVADVKRVANKYLSKNKSATSVILPIEKPIAHVVETKTHNAELVSQNNSTQKYKLDNDAILLLTPNNHNEIVGINITAKGGQFIEKIPATSNLTASLMLKGTQKYSSTELARIMEEKGIKISPSSGTDAFSISILTTKAELETTMELLNQIINNAIFEDYEIEKTRSEMLNNIKKSRDIPTNLAIEGYKSLIYEGSVYSNTSMIYEKTLPTIERKDILDYYNSIFTPENIVISINGDVDKTFVVNEFSEIFKSKKCSVFNYNKYSVPMLMKQKQVSKKIKDAQTAWMFLGWQTAGVLNQKECATLQIIDTILGSGMSSRLFRSVREQEGLAYQLGSGFSPNILRGAFYIYIGTNPKTLNLAKTKMLEEIERLKTEFVSDKELQEAKDQLFGNYVIALETNLEKATAIGWYEASGRGFDYLDKYKKMIDSITASDIVEVANKYFDDKYVQSVVN